MFTKIYLETTDPKLDLYALFRPAIFGLILFSVIFHTIVYIGFFNMVSYVFKGYLLSNVVNFRMIVILLLIMFLGYFGRYFHVKDILSAYGDEKLARQHIDKLYISWIFIA